MHAGKAESDGTHALVAHARKTTQAELARAIGVDRRTVAAWLAGRKRPSLDARRVIQQKLGIPVASWDNLTVHNRAPAPIVAEPLPGPPETPASAAVDSPADEQDDLPNVCDLIDVEISDPAAPGGSLEHKIEVNHSLRGLLELKQLAERDLVRTTAQRERAALIGALIRINAKLQEIERQIVANNETIFGSALFHDWLGRMFDVLAPWPEALAALAAHWEAQTRGAA